MIWKPDFTIQLQRQEQKREELKEGIKQATEELYDLPRHPVSDTTQFIVASTTIDTQKLKDPRFKENFENEIMSIDKFAPLSNIDLIDQLHTRLIWMDMIFAKRMGMKERFQRKSLEIIRLYNESRGRGGRFQDALITTRQELIARHKEDEQKKSKWGFMRKKQPPEEQYNPQGVQPQ